MAGSQSERRWSGCHWNWSALQRFVAWDTWRSEEAGSTVAPESLLTHVLQLVFIRPTSSAELRPGTGKTPTVNSPCDCHYAGTLIDGTEFDSSYKRGQPLTFAPNQVIKGWTEAMQLMKEGMYHHWIARANLFSCCLYWSYGQ